MKSLAFLALSCILSSAPAKAIPGSFSDVPVRPPLVERLDSALFRDSAEDRSDDPAPQKFSFMLPASPAMRTVLGRQLVVSSIDSSLGLFAVRAAESRPAGSDTTYRFRLAASDSSNPNDTLSLSLDTSGSMSMTLTFPAERDILPHENTPGRRELMVNDSDFVPFMQEFLDSAGLAGQWTRFTAFVVPSPDVCNLTQFFLIPTGSNGRLLTALGNTPDGREQYVALEVLHYAECVAAFQITVIQVDSGGCKTSGIGK
jgi:hypothetical protein